MNALKQAGAEVTLFAPKKGKIQSFKHHDKADHFDVDHSLADADANKFDAVLLPGGALNADTLRVQPQAQEFVREMDGRGKPIAVICHAPWLLISAGLVRRRSITSYHTIQDDIRDAGGKWQDQEVVRDKNWVRKTTRRHPIRLRGLPKACRYLSLKPASAALPNFFVLKRVLFSNSPVITAVTFTS